MFCQPLKCHIFAFLKLQATTWKIYLSPPRPQEGGGAGTLGATASPNRCSHQESFYKKAEMASGINNDATAVMDPLSPQSNDEQWEPFVENAGSLRTGIDRNIWRDQRETSASQKSCIFWGCWKGRPLFSIYQFYTSQFPSDSLSQLIWQVCSHSAATVGSPVAKPLK